MNPVSKTQLWTGRVISGIAVLFLAFDGVMKFTSIPEVLEGTSQLGYSVSVLPLLGSLLLIGVALHLVSRTSVIGAIWLTGYLGGAVATHVRLDNPLFTHVLFPTYIAAMVWGGLLLRNPRLRVLLNPSGETLEKEEPQRDSVPAHGTAAEA